MRRSSQSFVAAAVLAAAFFLGPGRAAGAQLEHEIGPDGAAVIRATGLALSEEALKFLRNAPAVYMREVFWVRVADAGETAPPVAGRHGVEADTLVFRPRFPLQPGMRYRVGVDLRGLNTFLAAQGIAWRGASDELALLTRDIAAPAVDATPVTIVTQIFPSVEVLPENQLKFYLHFSAPMQQGGVYRHLRLLGAHGTVIELPFLELEEELWDRDGKRFTLFIDPGRIKLGVKPREDIGPALEAQGRFTLIVDASWPDAAGRSLVGDFRKEFRVGPPDRESPRPADWKLQLPPAGTREPFVVACNEPLDHALLQRLVWVHDAKDDALAGQSAIGASEQRWEFTPDVPWRAGRYDLVVGTALEDLAGNSVARLFDREVGGASGSIPAPARVSVPFEIR